ncbi:putative F-box protein At1g47790 [Rutidosis leptorrhynchoides]|uniref:putative F-box protein At1g47790 n=1 Tax=Rutidosis leptorrhynchoides TaxID=125765 RepID=UPI003A995F8F
MSGHIPFEIQTEIVKRLPVKSLLQFRSVSKSWKSLIDTSEFITNYHSSGTHLQHRLLVRSIQSNSYDFDNEKYVSIVNDNDDDDSFPQNALTLIVPSSVRLLGEHPKLLGSSQGVFCFYQWPELNDTETTVVIWNPAIRKSLDIVVPNFIVTSILGFGVCPYTSDIKLVKVTRKSSWEAEVFTLRSGAWKSLSNNMPRYSVELWFHVCVGMFIYWLASDRTFVDDEKNIIVSFDMISDEFAEVYLPDSLVKLHCNDLEISRLRTYLVVLEMMMINDDKYEHCVWKMDPDVGNSFTKLFIIRPPDLPLHSVLGYRKTGKPIIEIYNYDSSNKKCALYCFEPDSENIMEIKICGYGSSGFANSYFETLLLLDY